MATHCGSTADNEVHTDAALYPVNGAHRLYNTVTNLA